MIFFKVVTQILEDGRGPLHLAAACGNTTVLDVLLRYFPTKERRSAGPVEREGSWCGPRDKDGRLLA